MTTTATIALKNIYSDIAERFNSLDYATYSTYYLKRSNTYYSYLLSSGANTTVEVLFNLYATCLFEEEAAKERALRVDNRARQQLLLERSNFFTQTKNSALDAILETAVEINEEYKENSRL